VSNPSSVPNWCPKLDRNNDAITFASSPKPLRYVWLPHRRSQRLAVMLWVV